MENTGVDDQVSMTVPDYEASSSSSNSEHSKFCPNKFQTFIEKSMVKLQDREGDYGEYGTIKQSLMLGMAFLGIHIVAIHKNTYSNHIGEAKLEAFRIFSRAVGERRGGDANIKYAWYGGSWDDICEILAYGFSKCTKFDDGSSSHGVGIVLSPANIPLERCSGSSALKGAVEDEEGVRHMLLCRVILGNTELVGPGSTQFQPTSADFDSGVDHPCAPTKYIVWRAHMNTHIFPNYVVSFKTSSLPGTKGIGPRAVKPNPLSNGMRMPRLLNGLQKFLHSSQMGLVLSSYEDFRENKISRRVLIWRLRSLVGDKLLTHVIKLCRDER